MIRIIRDDLAQIGVEFEKTLSKFLGEDQDITKSKLVKKIDKANNKGDHGLAEMIKFYSINRSRISEISSIVDLKSIIKDFESKFSAEKTIWENEESRKNKRDTQYGKFIKFMEKLYTDFMQSPHPQYSNIGMWLSTKLDIRTCPYCNRHYTFTIEKTADHPVVRPQFDHFFPKGLYPISALCFFNLIPACADCNKSKGVEILDIHPYESSFDEQGIAFYYNPTSDRKNPVLKISDPENQNIKHLGLSELYQGHSDIVSDLINKAEAYNLGYYSDLENSFSGLGLTPTEIDSAIWGTSLDENDTLNRPFSKFTRDILHQLGIL